MALTREQLIKLKDKAYSNQVGIAVKGYRQYTSANYATQKVTYADEVYSGFYCMLDSTVTATSEVGGDDLSAKDFSKGDVFLFHFKGSSITLGASSEIWAIIADLEDGL